MEINQERFEAWLFSQSDKRRVNYGQGIMTDRPGCILCQFQRENLPKEVHENVGSASKQSLWFSRLVFHPYKNHVAFTDCLTFGECKHCYVELFGNPNLTDTNTVIPKVVGSTNGEPVLLSCSPNQKENNENHNL